MPTKLLDDVVAALRGLRRSPRLTLLILLTLAVGVGANVAVFSALEGVLIDPLRVPEADRVVSVWRSRADGGFLVGPEGDQIAELRRSETLESVAALSTTEVMLTGRGPAEMIRAFRVSPGLFELLGARPERGRLFTSDEAERQERLAVVSRSLWRARLGGSPEAVGATIELDGEPHTVIGILPTETSVPVFGGQRADVWLPLVPSGGGSVQALARLRPGASAALAEGQLEPVLAGSDGWQARVMPLAEMASQLRSPLVLLAGAVTALLLVACINVTNLLLARALTQRRTLALRAALGARRGVLLRQALIEAALLAVGGAAAGILLAGLGLDALVALRPDGLSALDVVGLNGTVLLYALVLTAVVALVFGVGPALRTAGAEPGEALRSGGRSAAGGRGLRRVRWGLVVVEVAFSFALLGTAGLLLRSVAVLRATDPGFVAEGLAVAEVQLPAWKYPDASARAAVVEAVLDRLRPLPAVESATTAAGVPPSVGIFFGEVETESGPGPEEGSSVLFGSEVGPGYFATLGQVMLRGRGFTAADLRAGAEDVAVVGETTARRFWGSEDPVGQRFRLGADGPWLRVVGVARDVRGSGLGVAAERLQMWAPQEEIRDRVLLVLRTAQHPEALLGRVRREVLAVDEDIALPRVSTMPALLARSIARERFVTTVLGGFAAFAALFACLGLYGVLRHLVGQRTREFGIRIALGADAASVRALVLREGGAATALGLLLGAGLGVAGSRLVTHLLRGVGPADPAAWAGAAALLLAASLAASLAPARQAARVQPTEVMRAE